MAETGLVLSSAATAGGSRNEPTVKVSYGDDELAKIVADVDDVEIDGLKYVPYRSEAMLKSMIHLIEQDLSEPYSVYTYRYFVNIWPQLSFATYDGDRCVGTIVCRIFRHKSGSRRGYIGMIAVDKDYRKRGIGSQLVRRAIEQIKAENADEVVLEAEVCNAPAIALYEKLGFKRDKYLVRYYLNGNDAIRLKLWLK